MAQRIGMDRPVSPIAKELARDVPPRPSFLFAEIERNGVREVNAIERELAAEETNDTGGGFDESGGLRDLSRCLSLGMVGATGYDPSDDQKRG